MLKTISYTRFQVKLKATIQSSGRLGFTDKTAKELKLTNKSWVKFLQDEETKCFYMAITNESDSDAFPVKESGGYLYVPTKLMFDEYEFDYKNQTIMFDLVRKPALDDEASGEVYKMNKRIIPKREKGDNNDIVEEDE